MCYESCIEGMNTMTVYEKLIIEAGAEILRTGYFIAFAQTEINGRVLKCQARSKSGNVNTKHMAFTFTYDGKRVKSGSELQQYVIRQC